MQMANEDVQSQHVVTVNRSNDLKRRDASSAISGGGCILGRFQANIQLLLLISLAQNKLEPQGKPNWGTNTAFKIDRSGFASLLMGHTISQHTEQTHMQNKHAHKPAKPISQTSC